MIIKLFNTLTRKKEVFVPMHKSHVGFYACGPTVYNYAHIGNLRTYIFEDILKRTLKYAGYEVQHVMNITDIDDKTIAASTAEHMTLKNFTRKYESFFKNDLKQLNISTPTVFARATDYIEQMIADIRTILKNGFAYEKDGSVYFDVSKFKSYGKLARLDKKGLRDGARVDNDEYTKDEARDFVLWKARKDNEPFWSSSFGKGRPGWHIECSTMSTQLLGQPFDIHAAGVDLIFPHHENEIAQAEATNNKPLAKYWVHGEHLMIDGQKMSKSLGNIFTLRDLELKHIHPVIFRYLVLGAHYRSQLNFTWESLRAAETSLNSLYEFIRELKLAKSNKLASNKEILLLKKEFEASIADDLNTSKALASIWDIVHKYHKEPHKYNTQAILSTLYEFDTILGLNFKKITLVRIPVEIRILLKKREKSRLNKNFEGADAYRVQIRSLGWEIEDTKDGPRLKKL